MNAKQRATIAAQLATIATKHGATVAIDARSDEHVFTATFPDISVSVFIDGALGGGQMAHWHSAKRPIASLPFLDSVNEYHRAKASQYGASADLLAAKFQAACRAAGNGRLFAP